MKSLFIILAIPLFVITAQAQYGGGKGEPNDPYLIYTAEQMNEIGLYEDDWDKHFKLMSDIDLSAYKGTAFHIIGRFTPGSGPPVGRRGRGGGDPDEWKPFTGVFDGNDHAISAFTYDCNGISIVALFRCVGGSFAEIKDLGLIDPNVHAEAGNEVGSLVGRLMEGGIVVGCYVEGGRIEGSWSAGGLVGSNYQGMIKACHSTTSVSGNLSVGGIVGYNLEGTITHCYSHGNVWGDKRIGGLIGSNEGGKISVCYFSGPASGSYEVGGLVGENEDGTIIQCYSSGTVWGSEYIGGLVGSNYGWVNTSTASPDAILNCYSFSSVSGDDMVGGLVGAIMISSPAIGYPPGIPAFYESGPVTIRNCYATGSVVGGRIVGGLVGGVGTVCDCFWDTQTSGQTISARGECKTTAEMQTASTFIGWGGCGDEPIWTIDEGNDYPRLYWENKPGELLTVPPLSGLLLGSGTPDDPYLIHTPEELNLVAAALCDWDKCFRLMADIDLFGFSYEAALIAPDRDKMSVGFQGTPFSGVFDGNGHTISHLTIDGVSHLGLFGQLGSGAKITNLGLEAVDVNGSGDYVGGLVGQNFYDGSITTCYSAGMVRGERSWVGGLVGYNNGSITTCYSTSTVRGEKSYVGGLVGVNNGSIAASYSAGTVTGNSDVGGLVGFNRDSITTSYSTTAVTGDSSVGGLVGYNGGTTAMSYGIGPVTGNEEVGGLVGDDEGKIFTRPGSTGNTTSSFWNMETSSQTESAGGEGKTTTEMQTASTFLEAGWDFSDVTVNGTEDIWWILEGQHYPRLWWQYGRAFSPYPQDGAVNIPQPLNLSWLPGGSGLYHDIYFGEDKEAVANATIESQEIYRRRLEPEITTYNLDTLELEKTYYWRIDEVNEDNPNSPWKGDVWCFTTAHFIVVDDFENYDRGENQIWFSWHDGLGSSVPESFFPGNGTGSVIGDLTTPSNTEETIIHEGKQSMPYEYDNNKQGFTNYSEATLTLSYPLDWTEGGTTILTLWFYGDPANAPEPMYVAVSNSVEPTAVVVHSNAASTQITTWTEWVIPLQAFTDQGIDLTDVNSIAIGFGDRNNPQPGGRGKMYFDDIRLYPPRPVGSLDLEVNIP